MKASLLSPGVLSSILGSRMVFGMIPGFYDYETFIESFLRFEPGTNFGCGRRIDQLAILAFKGKKFRPRRDSNPQSPDP